MPVFSTVQKTTLAGIEGGTDLMQQYETKKVAIAKLKQTGKYRAGQQDAKTEMTALQTARDGLVASMHELLRNTRGQAMTAVGGALGQIVTIAQAAQANVAIAQNADAVVVSHLSCQLSRSKLKS